MNDEMKADEVISNEWALKNFQTIKTTLDNMQAEDQERRKEIVGLKNAMASQQQEIQAMRQNLIRIQHGKVQGSTAT